MQILSHFRTTNLSGASFKMGNGAAFFDIDGTIYDGVISIDFLIYLLKSKKIKLRGIVKMWKFLYYYILDRFNLMDRLNVNKKIYVTIIGWKVQEVNQAAKEFYYEVGAKKIYPKARQLIDEHIRNKNKVVAVTSELKNIVTPLKKDLKLDKLFGTEVGSNNGKFNGFLHLLPIGKNRAVLIRNYCKFNSIDMKKSYAYSDHHSDIAMMNLVGNPVAVNPDKKLRRYAKNKSWKTITFK